MAVTLYGGIVLDAASNADDVTGWSAGSVDNELAFEGTGAVGAKSGAGISRFVFTNGTAINFNTAAAGRHIYIWYNFLNAGTLSTTGGARGFVGNDATTNFEEFTTPQTAAGTYTGGWVNVAFPGSGIRAPDFSSGTYSAASANSFGITFNGTVGIMGNYNNALVDQITISLGLQATGAGQTFLDFTAAENTNLYGIVVENNGILFAQGKLRFGDGTTTTTFTSTVDTVIFSGQPVDAGFYELLFESGSTNTFGSFSGGSTSQGSTFRGASSTDTYIISCNGTSVVDFYSCNVSEASSVNLNSTSSSIGSTYNNCGQIAVNSATFQDNNVLATTSSSAVLTSDLGNVTGNNFVSDGTAHAVELTSLGGGIMTWDNTFNAGTYASVDGSTGSEVLYVNVASGTLDISVASGADAPTVRTAGATVNVLAGQVSFSITGLRDGTEVRIIDDVTNNEIAGVEDVTGGIGTSLNGVTVSGTTDDNDVTYTYTYTADTPIRVAIVSTQYLIVYLTADLVNENQSIPVVQIFDRNYDSGSI